MTEARAVPRRYGGKTAVDGPGVFGLLLVLPGIATAEPDTLAPWPGFAVFCACVAVVAAAIPLKRRDA